jgi:hypothetical protein
LPACCGAPMQKDRCWSLRSQWRSLRSTRR